jgi:hypothetical protein
VTLVPETLNETNQTPPFTITAQTPQLSGSDDPRLTAFNQRMKALVSKEVDTWRQSFLQNTFPTVTNGSFLEASYTLLSQIEDVWSFKFDFHFYSDGATVSRLTTTSPKAGSWHSPIFLSRTRIISKRSPSIASQS